VPLRSDVRSLDRSRRALVLSLTLGLVLLTLAAYLPVLGNGFVDYDDGQYVTANPRVQAGLTADGVAWALTARVAGNWHPLTLLSHMLDCQLFGLNPRGHHLTSLLLHLANVLLLFAVLLAMTGAPWRCAAVAVLFALHPTHVESVAWVAERKDVLSAMFWLLAMAAYVHYAHAHTSAPRPRHGATGWYLAVVVLFAIGLAAKPMVVTLPFALLLLDLWPLGRLRLGAEGPGLRAQLPLLWEKVPLLALSAAACGVTLAAQASTVSSLGKLPLGARLANAAVSYVAYLGQTLLPRNLAVFYPLRADLSAAQVAGAALLLAALTAAALLAARRAPYLTVGWLWYLGVLVPVIGIVQVGAQARSDRYTYLPSIGLYVAGVWGAAALLCRLRGRLAAEGVGEATRRPALVHGITALVAAAVLLGLVVQTRAQVATWADSTTLFRHALAVTRDNYLAHLDLGNALSEAGKSDEAFAHFRAAQAIAPHSLETNAALAAALSERGRPAGAVPLLRTALGVDPRDARLHFDLAVALDDLGEPDAAIGELETAVALDPGMARAHHGLGMLLLKSGRTEEGRVQLRAAVAADPSLREQLAPLLADGGGAGD
jgi:protein O-mannosyl-transferase